jgi:DNA-binding NtrC family response regulator
MIHTLYRFVTDLTLAEPVITGLCRGIRIAEEFRVMDFPAKVLIVEDDNAMAQMCAKLIRRHGHTALIANSCHDALVIVREAGDIDVVLSDIQMPEISGFQLLSALHDVDSTLPVILMTGYAHLLAPSDAFDYLMKPFEPETLLGSLERARRSRILVRND